MYEQIRIQTKQAKRKLLWRPNSRITCQLIARMHLLQIVSSSDR
jgi:hypothetical protein